MVFHECQRVTQLYARRHDALYHVGIELLKLGALAGFNRGFISDQRGQGDLFTAGGGDVVIIQRAHIGTKITGHLWDYLVAAPFQAETVDKTAAQHGGQVLAYIFHGNAKVRSQVAIDQQRGFRPGKFHRFLQEHEVATLHARGNQFVGDFIHSGVTGIGSDDKTDGQSTTGSGQTGAGENGGLETGDPAQLLLQLWLDFHLRAGSCRRRVHFESAEHCAGVTAESQQVKTLVVLGDGFEGFLYFISVGFVVLQGGCLRRAGHEKQYALIFCRRQGRGRGDKHEIDTDQHTNGKHHHDAYGLQRAVQQLLIATGQPAEKTLHPQFKSAGLAMNLEYLGRQHGRQGQGHHARYHHRASEGKCKLYEQGANQSTHEGKGRIDRHQGGGHGDDRHCQFTRALQGCLHPVCAVFYVPVHILDHDNGVVDHQPYGQHHRQQGQQVY